MPSISTSRAPGIASAVARPPDGVTSRSRVPWMTTVGALIVAQLRRAVAATSRSRRAGARSRPGRGRARSSGWATARSSSSSNGKPGEPISAHRLTASTRSRASRSSAGRRAKHRVDPRRPGVPCQHVPGVGHDRGERAAPAPGGGPPSVWAIMPPIEAPATCARSIPSAVEQPDRRRRPCRRASRRGALSRSEQLLERRRAELAQVRRAPDVAVVVADDVEAAVGELPAERVGPADHLRAEAHDEQQRRILPGRRTSRSRARARRPSPCARPSAHRG